MTLLSCEGLAVRYGPIQAVRGISFRIEEGQIVALIGANGAGKSTTLRALSGILRKAAGRIIFRDQDITHAQPHQIVARGLVQVPEGRAVVATMSVQENLELGGYSRRDRTTLAHDIAGMYQRFPILGQRRHLPAAQLSGGEQQILVIARGLLARPQLLLLDEPSLGLAPQLVREVMRLVKHIREEGTTVLLVEQNARQALALADHAYVLEQGRISLEGSGRALLADPAVIKAYLGVAPAMQVARHSES
ncbi:MAG TPA: ABC transporter ATP-binding protein [Chloroflexota bacterium]|nr:ABC transporter ATP-binding protein [Chloroflexota bacterium]